jgi:signal transduction histidine kinase
MPSPRNGSAETRKGAGLLGRVPFRHQLALAALLPVVLIGLVATLVNASALRQTTLDLVLQRNAALVQVAAAAVAENLEGYLRPLQATAEALAFYSAVPDEAERVLQARASFLQLFEGGVLLLDQDGLAIASTPGHEERVGRDYSFRDYFQQAKASREPVFSAVLQESPSGQDAVAIVAPVLNGDDFSGALVGVFFLAQQPWAEDLKPLQTPQGGEAGLVDADGIILSHPDAERTGSSAADDPVLAQLVGAGRPRSMVADSPRLGQEVVASYAPLPGIGWGLIMEEPWQPIIGPTRPYQVAAGALLGLGFVGSLVVLLAGINRVNKPLDGVVREARRVSAGEVFRPLAAEGPPEMQALISAINQMVIRLAEQRATLQHYAMRVLESQEEERKRIARDLHDETVQDLVAVMQRLELWRGAMDDQPAQSTKWIEELDLLVRGALADVRRMSNDLRPFVLEDLGLRAALEYLTEEVQLELEAVQIHTEIVGSERRLPPELELTVFRIVQEALTNVRKHARNASRVNVTLYYEDWGVLVTVEDDGPGFEAADAADRIRKGHLGLAGMAERAQLFDGGLEVTSSPGRGTTVQLRLPCAKTLLE